MLLKAHDFKGRHARIPAATSGRTSPTSGGRTSGWPPLETVCPSKVDITADIRVSERLHHPPACTRVIVLTGHAGGMPPLHLSRRVGSWRLEYLSSCLEFPGHYAQAFTAHEAVAAMERTVEQLLAERAGLARARRSL